MTHAGRRVYRRRRQRRARWLRRTVLLLLLAGAAVLAVRQLRNPVMQTRLMQPPTPTPVSSSFDQTVESRNVLLTTETWYAIQTGVFSTRDAALDRAGAYTDRGAPGVVVQDGEKWRVFIACYGTEEDAAAVRTRLGEMQRVDTYLYRWECPVLQLRLTGMAGQLDVVEAGFELLMQTAVQLRDASILLDAGEMSTQDVRACMADMDGQIALWAETAEDRFGSTVPELVQQLLSVTDGWRSRRSAVEGAMDSATTLSAALKEQGMGMYDEIIAMRSAISSN